MSGLAIVHLEPAVSSVSLQDPTPASTQARNSVEFGLRTARGLSQAVETGNNSKLLYREPAPAAHRSTLKICGS